MPLLAVLLLLACSAASQSPPEAAVSSGRLQGKWMRSRDGRSIAAFEGIPYAAPPLGDLRFQPPQRPLAWQGVRQATAPGAQCTQMSDTSSEDCLFVNVYAPHWPQHTSLSLHVLVYIHGGAFHGGSGDLYMPDYLLDHDIVFVTLNYRLGPLGFFSTSDDVIPGNAGLKDQVFALRWIKDNIKAFGGDADNVTIYGQSAGSVCVHLLTLSPLAKGLFHRAFAQSATPLSPWGFSEPGEPQLYASQAAQALGCPAEPSTALRDCLLGLPAMNISAVESSLMRWGRLDIAVFKPVAEAAGVAGAFLTRHPRDILASTGPESDVPLLMGFNSQDGGTWAAGIHKDPAQLQEFDSNFELPVSAILNTRQLSQKLVEDTTSKLRNFYYGGDAVSNNKKENTVDIITDAFFIWPTVRTVKLLLRRRTSAVYLCEFAYQSTTALFPGLSESFDYGVGHSDDLMYIYPMSSSIVRTEEDVKVSRSFLQLYANFVTKGNPTEDGLWSRVQDPEAPEYLRIASTGDLRSRRNCAPERMQFWKQLPVPIGDATTPSSSSPGAETRTWSAAVLAIFITVWNLSSR